MRAMRWLAAVAGVALVAGAPTGAGAATAAAKATPAKAKAKKRKPVRRVRVVRARAAVVVPPLIVTPPPPLYVPTAPAPRANSFWADYRWLDDADAMLSTIGQSRPDVVFAVERDALYAWTLSDGSVAIAEPLGATDQRWYFFAPDVTVPFLVRDLDRSFALEHGRLAALYDREGTLLDWRPGDAAEAQAADLADRGRQLWLAAHAPQPLPSRAQSTPWWGQFFFGGDIGWRINDGRRTYRAHDRREDRASRDERYRHEREDRAARGDRWHAAHGTGTGYWSGGRSTAPGPGTRPEGAERPPTGPRGRPPGRPTPTAPPPGADRPGGTVEAPMRTVPAGSTEGIERRSAEPERERSGRRNRPADAPAAPVTPVRESEAAPVPAPAADRAPRERPDRDAAPRRDRTEGSAAPEPAPRAAPARQPDAEPPPRPREPEPAPPPRVESPPQPAPPPRVESPPEPTPPPSERPREHLREDERPQ